MSNKIITQEMLANTESFTEAVKPGSYVEDAIVDNFLNCVPPATHRHNLIQCGEPYSSAWDEDSQRYRATYITFSLSGLIWQYAGTCFIGETTHKGLT